MRNKIAVLGFGWLAQELIQQLKKNSTIDIFSRNQSQKDAIQTYILGDKIPENLNQSEVIVFTIPPRLRKIESTTVLETHESFFRQIPKDTYLIYTSSTSVYKESGILTEKSECSGDLFLIEEIIRARFERHLIFRLGGLAGPNRIIVNHLQKKGVIDSYDAPTNLLHLYDVVHAIALGLSKNLTGTYNLCCSEHPIKAEVYNHWNSKFGFPKLPNGEKSTLLKTISNEKFISETSFQYKYANPLEFDF